MKRKNFTRYAKVSNVKTVSDATPTVSKRAARRERLQRLLEMKEKAIKDYRLLDFFLNVFRPHWAAFLFWPLLGFVWGAMRGFDCCSYDFALMGVLAGVGVAFFFALGERKFFPVILAVYGALAAYSFAAIVGDLENGVVYASIGFVIGLFGRFIIGILLRYSQAL